MVKIIFLSGSLRADSFNKRLALVAFNYAKNLDINPVYIDLMDYPLPIYNADIEQQFGLPDNVYKLKELFRSSHGIFICSPEYNGSFSAVLKNTIDWISRPINKDDFPLSSFKSKVVALGSVSPGKSGGSRGLLQLKMLMQNIGVNVISEQLTVPCALEMFRDNKDSFSVVINKQIEIVINSLVKSLKISHEKIL